MPIINTQEPDVVQVMVYPEMLRAYEAHLAKEFSSENMAFIRAVNDLQNKATDPSVTDAALKDQAAAIYDHYMKTGSTREVNLAAPNLKQFEDRLANLANLNRQETASMFKECHKEINGLISKDSFRRFVGTKEFHEAAQLVDDNFDTELEIPELREQAEQARLNPSVGDLLKAPMGGKTKAQELTERANLLQQQLDTSRTVAPLDIPETNTQTVINHAAALSAQRIPPPPPEELDNDIPPPPPELEVDNNIDIDIPLPPPELEQEPAQDVPLVPPQVGHGQGGQPPQEVAPRGPQVPVVAQGQAEGPQMVVEEMSVEEVDQLNVGQGRDRGQGLDGDGVGQTRERSRAVGGDPPGPTVRDALGRRDSLPKQGQGGPKVT